MDTEYIADVCIIGAGVVGCAVARELQLRGLKTVVVDRNEHVGMGITSRNSEVIHAGLYYPTGSLKAELCVEGNKLLYEYCEKKGVTHKRIGKFIVAINQSEVEELEQVRNRGVNNGVKNLNYISLAEFKEIEPEVSASQILFSRDTGVLSAHEFCNSLQNDALAAGAEFVFRTEVIGLEVQADRSWKVLTNSVVKNSEQAVGGKAHVNPKFLSLSPTTRLGNDEYEFRVGAVVNSAGLHADWISALAGIDIKAANYELCWVKGDYFSLNSKWQKRLSHLIYPIPEKNIRGLGTHVTIDIGGQVKLGPNVVEIDRHENYEVDANSKKQFFDSANRYLPNLVIEDLAPAYSGIRPKLSKSGEPFRDFVIAEESARGFLGLISLVGIESPGLTSALAIAKKVSQFL